MRTTLQEPDHSSEDHDPMCPRSDIDAAWNGAMCQCVVIRLLRGMKDTDILQIDAEATLAAMEERIIREIAESEGITEQQAEQRLATPEQITQGHDPLCPPGLKAAPPERCTWCLTIRQARTEGPLT